MSNTHEISLEELTLEQAYDICAQDTKLELSETAIKKITDCREYLDNKIKTSSEPIYGINTGFGSLYDRHISSSDLRKLQENLVKSHACGTGDEVPNHIVRCMLFLKIQSLAYGHSGVQLETVQRLIDYFNEDITPVVYEMGSLGASGDLAPLAHLSLPLLGLGQVYCQDKLYSGASLNELFDWKPIQFKAKEGLALLNGTQLMAAYGLYSSVQSLKLLKLANKIGALSLDTFDGRIEPFHSEVHEIRPHQGQVAVAKSIRSLLQGSQIINQPKKHVQDPYSFRCMPQVHGASLDAITYCSNIFKIELNSVTDNPNVFVEEDEIISAGNFHGQPLALPLDFLAISLAEIGSISERRTYQLISGNRELPHYLVANPGINSGLMIPQYTAASLVSQNKQYCTPASVDSIVSSNGQEDHVSMGANAATKLYKVVQNTYRILAIEMLTAAQALEFRRPLRSSAVIEEFVDNFRKHVSFIEEDRLLHNDIEKSIHFLKDQKIASLD